MKELPQNTISAKYHDLYWLPVAAKADLVASIDEDERFYNGEHYLGDNPGNYIRIISNHVADGIRKIASKLNGTPLHLGFTASDNTTDCTLLSRHDRYVLSTMGHEAFSLQSAINGENLGTEITYLGFDADRPWQYGSRFAGGLFESHISPKNFAVANIHQPNVQAQAWVMTWYDVSVRELIALMKKEMFTDEEYKERLNRLYKEGMARSKRPDDQNPSKELMAEALVRVYYREFRISGEVCYTLETETVPLFKFPKPKSKVVRKAFAEKAWKEFLQKSERKDPSQDIDERDFSLIEDMEIDFEDSIVSIEKKVSASDKRSQAEKFCLYSFAVFTPKKVNNFFFGRSLTKEMIPMQKGINYALSMMLKSLENTAYGKVVAREGAMKNGETWENGPESNLVHDHYKGNGNGFYTISPASMPADLFKLAEYYVGEMKDANGFNDFANGEMANKETSGYAVSLMLKQANSTLEQEQKLFWQYQVDLARIRIMYYKHYFSKSCFTYEYTDAEYAEEERARKSLLNQAVYGKSPIVGLEGEELDRKQIIDVYRRKTPRSIVQEFDPDTIWGVDFDIQIIAQQGLVESELATSQWYTEMFGNGGIQAFVQNPDMLKFVVRTAPPASVPEEMRASMLHYADEMEQSALAMLRQQLAQAQQEIEMLRGALDSAAKFGKAQEEEFKRGITAANHMVQNAQNENAKTQKQMSLMRQGVSEGEVKSNNAKGISTQVQQQNVGPII